MTAELVQVRQTRWSSQDEADRFTVDDPATELGHRLPKVAETVRECRSRDAASGRPRRQPGHSGGPAGHVLATAMGDGLSRHRRRRGCHHRGTGAGILRPAGRQLLRAADVFTHVTPEMCIAKEETPR